MIYLQRLELRMAIEKSDTLFEVRVQDLKKMVPKYELPHDKTNKMTCAPSEDSDQPGHPPSLIRVFAVRSLGS